MNNFWQSFLASAGGVIAVLSLVAGIVLVWLPREFDRLAEGQARLETAQTQLALDIKQLLDADQRSKANEQATLNAINASIIKSEITRDSLGYLAALLLGTDEIKIHMLQEHIDMSTLEAWKNDGVLSKLHTMNMDDETVVFISIKDSLTIGNSILDTLDQLNTADQLRLVLWDHDTFLSDALDKELKKLSIMKLNIPSSAVLTSNPTID